MNFGQHPAAPHLAGGRGGRVEGVGAGLLLAEVVLLSCTGLGLVLFTFRKHRKLAVQLVLFPMTSLGVFWLLSALYELPEPRGPVPIAEGSDLGTSTRPLATKDQDGRFY